MAKRSTKAVISLDGVTKKFGDVKAVNDLSLEVYKGEIFGFLGPNGAGKTTTIRLILDVLRPSKGKIKIFGIDSVNNSQAHKRIGYLSGEMVFDDDLTGEQYLHFLNVLFGGNYNERIIELADLLKIDLRKKIGNYSRGNKQKVGLIGAMMHNPELLILDEPTNGFDPLVQETFANLIREYSKKGGTVFMSSHILSEVQELCDRVSFINEGSIVGTTSIGDLLETASKKIRVITSRKDHVRLKAEYSKLQGLVLTKELPNSLVFSYRGDVRKLLEFFSKQNVSDINIQEPDLEDVFVKYYQKNPEGELS